MMDLYKDFVSDPNSFRDKSLIYAVANASADYIDPVTRQCYDRDDLPSDEITLIPLPDINELELLKKYIEERMSSDKRNQKTFLREIQDAMSAAPEPPPIHQNEAYSSYSQPERSCIHALFTFFESNRMFDDYSAFREKEMLAIAKAWYEENELWGL